MARQSTVEVMAVRLHVVTGKGGTGKTTVAGALALALASGDRRVLVMEVEGRQGLAQLFDTPPLPYEGRRVAVAPGGGEVFALAVDAEEALLEYLAIFYHLGRAGRVLDRMGAVDFATTVAPGLRDVLLTGKAYEAVRHRRGGRRTYDAVVLDAPPTGRITRFLNVNTEVAGLAKVGPVRSQADSIMGLIRSSATAVHLVTLLEEMPVQETVDAVAELREVGLPVGAVVVNMVRRPPLRPSELTAAAKGRLDAGEVAAGLKAAGLPSRPAVVEALLSEAAELAERTALERRERRAVSGLGRPTFELPWLPDGVDLGGLYELAGALIEQGVPR
jgi:anion-transporting  ArsA/GET3 family ATPase